MASSIKFNSVKLIKGGVIDGNEKATGAFTTSDAYYSFGGETDLWGLSFTPDDINASDFGVVVSMIGDSYEAYNEASQYLSATNFGFAISSSATIDGILVEVEGKETTASGISNASIDHVRITIYYTESGVTSTQTITAKANLSVNREKTITAKASIKIIVIQTLTSKARILILSTQTVNTKALIQLVKINTVTAKAKIICISKPILINPAQFETKTSPVTLVWEIPTCCQGRNIHVNIQIDKTNNTFGDIEIDLYSFKDSGFEYWDGDSWEVYPTMRVASTYYGNQARVTVELTAGTKYWRVKGGVK